MAATKTYHTKLAWYTLSWSSKIGFRLWSLLGIGKQGMRPKGQAPLLAQQVSGHRRHPMQLKGGKEWGGGEERCRWWRRWVERWCSYPQRPFPLGSSPFPCPSEPSVTFEVAAAGSSASSWVTCSFYSSSELGLAIVSGIQSLHQALKLYLSVKNKKSHELTAPARVSYSNSNKKGTKWSGVLTVSFQCLSLTQSFNAPIHIPLLPFIFLTLKIYLELLLLLFFDEMFFHKTLKNNTLETNKNYYDIDLSINNYLFIQREN